MYYLFTVDSENGKAKLFKLILNNFTEYMQKVVNDKVNSQIRSQDILPILFFGLKISYIINTAIIQAPFMPLEQRT